MNTVRYNTNMEMSNNKKHLNKRFILGVMMSIIILMELIFIGAFDAHEMSCHDDDCEICLEFHLCQSTVQAMKVISVVTLALILLFTTHLTAFLGGCEKPSKTLVQLKVQLTS